MAERLTIYTYQHRTVTAGRKWECTWSELVERLSRTRFTSETMAEYARLSDAERGEIKDRGGFIGGEVLGGRRSKDNIVSRCVLTLDADAAQPDDWDTFHALYADEQTGAAYNACVYPTHSHTPESPRIRWVFPLKRPVSPDEYRALARAVAGWVGLDTMDESTYQPERLMYWPTSPRDCDYQAYFRANVDGVPLDPDAILAQLGPIVVSPMRRASAPVRSADTLPGVIPCGNRDNLLTSIAGRARRAGFGPEEIRALLGQVNIDRCEEPLDDADLDRIARSVSRYAPADSGLVGLVRRGEDLIDLGATYIDCDVAELAETGSALGLGDMLVAKGVYAALGEQVRYNAGMGVMMWNGTHYEENPAKADWAMMVWVERARASVMRAARELEPKITEAENYGDEKEAMEHKRQLALLEAEYKFLGKYLDHGKRAAALEDWKTLMYEPEDKFDADPFLLNTPEGVVDLHTGELRPARFEDRCTKTTSVAPGEKGALMWQAFVENVTGGDTELAEYLQQMFGLAAIGKVLHEGMYIILGDGGTGKSTMVNAIREVFGSYAGGMQNQTLLSDRRANTGADMATLQGKRLIIAAELEENCTLSASQLKLLTSTDRVRAEPKYKAPYDFSPSHTILLFSNFLPRVSSTDRGTWRRLVVLPFRVNQLGEGEIKNYAEKLVREAGPAILQWVIEGALKIANNGFEPPHCTAAEDELAGYRLGENTVLAFVQDAGVTEKEAFVPSTELCMAYNRWATALGERPTTVGKFSRELTRLGYERSRTNQTRGWRGLRLRNYQDELQEAAKGA